MIDDYDNDNWGFELSNGMDKEGRQRDAEIAACNPMKYVGLDAAIEIGFMANDEEDRLEWRFVDTRYETEDALDLEHSYRGYAQGIDGYAIRGFGRQGNVAIAMRADDLDAEFEAAVTREYGPREYGLDPFQQLRFVMVIA